MEQRPPNPENLHTDSERLGEDTRAFYDFVLGRQPEEEEIFDKYFVIAEDVEGVNDKVMDYQNTTPGTRVKVFVVAYGRDVPTDYLVGCDPSGELFVIVEKNDH